MSMQTTLHGGKPLAWSGTYPGSPGRFQIRPSALPRDALSVYDDDIDCVIGYQRVFRRVVYAFDLLGQCAKLWTLQEEETTQCVGETQLAVGELWQPGVRAMTRSGHWACGAMLGQDSRAALRRRFAELANASLSLAGPALKKMADADQFVPIHILRLAILTGRRTEAGSGRTFCALMALGSGWPPEDGFHMLTVKTDRAAAVIDDFHTEVVPDWMADR